MSDSVVTDLTNGVFTVTLNEPDTMNALSPAITQGLFDAIERANAEDDIRVLLLTGSGRGFCAGAAVGGGGPGAARAEPSRRRRLDQRGTSAQTVDAIANCEVPVIAAVNGPLLARALVLPLAVTCACSANRPAWVRSSSNAVWLPTMV